MYGGRPFYLWYLHAHCLYQDNDHHLDRHSPSSQNMAFGVQTCREFCLNQAIMLDVYTTGLAVPHQSLGLQIAHGPISIAVGLAAGGLLGFVCALSPIWSSPWRKTVALLVTGELLAFCGYELCWGMVHCAMLCCTLFLEYNAKS